MIKNFLAAICLVMGLQVSGVFAMTQSSPIRQHVAALDEDVTIALKASDVVEVKLIGAPGALVTLSLYTDGTPFDAALLSDRGEHQRSLLQKGEGRKHVVILLPDEPAHLTITTAIAGSLTLRQTGSIEADDLKSPPRDYLSPKIVTLARNLEHDPSTDAFWQMAEAEGTPLVEEGEKGKSLLTFLFRGASRNVKMLGGPTNDIYELERLGQSDVWFRTIAVPEASLFSYQLADDVPSFVGPVRARRLAILSTAKADPLNRFPWPASAPDNFNQSSTFRAAGGGLEPWYDQATNQRGTLTHHRLASERLANTRDIWIHRSAGVVVADEATPLLFVFDGEQFLKKGLVDRSIDALVEAGRIPPMVTVFVSSVDNVVRARELPDSDAFADFMADELLPFVIDRTGLRPRGDRTILSGSSFGGLGSTTIALKRPEKFGAVLSVSGSYWWSPQGAPEGQNTIAHRVATSEPKKVRFYLSAGLFEASRGDGFASILEPNRYLSDVLTAKGYEVKRAEFPTAHDMFAWREILPQGLIHLVGR